LRRLALSTTKTKQKQKQNKNRNETKTETNKNTQSRHMAPNATTQLSAARNCLRRRLALHTLANTKEQYKQNNNIQWHHMAFHNVPICSAQLLAPPPLRASRRGVQGRHAAAAAADAADADVSEPTGDTCGLSHGRRRM
jgi:hypothetical protein